MATFTLILMLTSPCKPPLTAHSDEFELPLRVRLVFNEKARSSVEKDVMEVDPAVPRLGRHGKCSFRVRLRDVSMNFDNRDFRLQVAVGGGAKGSGLAVSKYFVAPVFSDPMTVVRHRLRIRSETQPPTVWYKDEGGRDKCMEVAVDLVDSEGRRVHGQEVPLRVSLLYEDLQPVGKQDILKLSSDSRQSIDHTGTAMLRLRIEDVSKNHQSKGFVIQVGADVQHAPLNSDISPDTSTSVSVRSKRNRRSKQGRGAMGERGGGLGGVNGGGDEDTSLVGHTLSRNSIDLAMPVVSHSLLQETAQLAMLSSVNGGGGEAGSDARGGVGLGLGIGPHGDAGASGGGAAPLMKALSNVISWTRTVVNGLYQLQWQLIGYESKPDGAPDVNKPLFNIQNPNAVITNILHTYRGETMEQLRYLVLALEAMEGAWQGGQGEGEGLGRRGTGIGMDAGGGQREGPPRATASGGREGEGNFGRDGFTRQGGASTFAGSMDHGVGAGRSKGEEGQLSRQQSNHFLQDTLQRPSPNLMPPVGPMLPPMIRGRSGLGGNMPADASGGGTGGAGGEFGGVGLVPLVRESTYELLAGMDPSWFGMEGAEMSPSAATEAQVQMIMAKEYYSETYETLGFPAFDLKHNLLGFYKEARNDQGQTVALYVPIPPQFSEEDRRAVDEMLETELKAGGAAVVQIANEDISQLKERVLTYHWSQESRDERVLGGGDDDGDVIG